MLILPKDTELSGSGLRTMAVTRVIAAIASTELFVSSLRHCQFLDPSDVAFLSLRIGDTYTILPKTYIDRYPVDEGQLV